MKSSFAAIRVLFYLLRRFLAMFLTSHSCRSARLRQRLSPSVLPCSRSLLQAQTQASSLLDFGGCHRSRVFEPGPPQWRNQAWTNSGCLGQAMFLPLRLAVPLALLQLGQGVGPRSPQKLLGRSDALSKICPSRLAVTHAEKTDVQNAGQGCQLSSGIWNWEPCAQPLVQLWRWPADRPYLRKRPDKMNKRIRTPQASATHVALISSSAR